MGQISKGRENDREIRLCLLQTAATLLKTFERTGDDKWLELVEYYESEASRIDERMKNNDYSELDAMYARVEEQHKRWMAL